MSKTRCLLLDGMHEKALGWVLNLVAERGLVKGERVGVGGSTMEANAALRTILRHDSGETYREMLTRMAKESGVETLTLDDLVRLDRNRKGKKLSNEDWMSQTGPDAKIAGSRYSTRANVEHSSGRIVTSAAFCRSTFTTQSGAGRWPSSCTPARRIRRRGSRPTAPTRAAHSHPLSRDPHRVRRRRALRVARGDDLVQGEQHRLRLRSCRQDAVKESGRDRRCRPHRARIDDKAVVRRDAETRHKAKSWICERRAAARIEATRIGLSIRFVV